MIKLSERLRLLRGSESQTEFASRFGLKQAIYSHYETGRKKPSLEVLVDMALKLGTSTDFLLGLTDIPKSKSPDLFLGNLKTGNHSQVAIGNNITLSSTKSKRSK